MKVTLISKDVMTVVRHHNVCAGGCWCAGLTSCKMFVTVKDAQGNDLGACVQQYV